jgi:hypothetical protein
MRGRVIDDRAGASVRQCGQDDLAATVALGGEVNAPLPGQAKRVDDPPQDCEICGGNDSGREQEATGLRLIDENM